jgi:hypothetical protein
MSYFDQISSPYGVGAAPFRPPLAPLPAVGLLPPNSNTASESTLASVSAGRLPNNVQIAPSQAGSGVANPTLTSINVTAGANGAQGLAGANSLLGSANIGSDGPAAPGVNVAAGPTGQVETTSNIPTSVLATTGALAGGVEFGTNLVTSNVQYGG